MMNTIIGETVVCVCVNEREIVKLLIIVCHYETCALDQVYFETRYDWL